MQRPLRSTFATLFAIGVVLSTAGFAQQVIRVSRNDAGQQGNAESFSPAISADGQWVAYASHASNLVANDTNGACDVFLTHVQSGTTTRVSVGSGGLQGNSHSGIPEASPPDLRRVVAISGDGTRIAFVSDASNFAPGAAVGTSQVYFHDRVSGMTALASRTPGGTAPTRDAWQPVFSGNGQFVFFLSTGSEILPGGQSFRTDLFAYDVFTATVTRVFAPPTLVNKGGWVEFCSSSTDGRHLAFASVVELTQGYEVEIVLLDRDSDANGIFDEPGFTTTREISTLDLGNETPDMGADGRFVVWQDDRNVMHHDRDVDQDGILDEPGATLTRTVARTDTEVGGWPWPYQLSISADGRWLGSYDRLVQPFAATPQQLFVRDVNATSAHLASRSASGQPASMRTLTGTIALTPDSAFVAFDSRGPNLVTGDTNGVSDVFVAARPSGTATGDATRYCASTPNGVGLSAHIGFDGSTSVSASDLVLKAFDTQLSPIGKFYFGPVPTQVPFGNGNRCVGAGSVGFIRLPTASFDAWGYPSFAFPVGSTPAGGVITPGSSWCFQFWFRDVAGGGAGFDLTDGLLLVFGP